MPRRSTRNSTKKVTHVSPSSEDGDLIDEKPPTPSSSKKGKAPAKKIRLTDHHSPDPEMPEITPSMPQIADPGPEFQPLHPKASPHRAYNTLPASIRGLDVVEPIQILRVFLIENLLETIAENNNAYAVVKRRESNQITGRPWLTVVRQCCSHDHDHRPRSWV
jgi:hypothetical protein